MTTFPYTFSSKKQARCELVFLLERISDRLSKIKTRPTADPEETIHEIRILTKFLRALLWLAQPSFTPSVATTAKQKLRAAARDLAAERDLTAMRSVLKDLAKRASSKKKAQKALRQTRHLFIPNGNGEKRAAALHRAMIHSVTRLRQAVALLKNPAHHGLEEKLPERLDKAFRLMHRARRTALQKGNAVDYHEWRKKAKRLLYLLQCLEPDPDKKMARTIKQIDQLQHWLGDHHDNIVLKDRLEMNPPANLRIADLDALFALLKKREHHLLQKAEKMTTHFARK